MFTQVTVCSFVKELQASGKRRWKVSSGGTRSHQLLTRPRVNLFSRRRGRWIRLVQSTRWRTALQQHVRRSAWCNEVVANFFLRTVEHKISKNHLQWSPSFLHWPVTIVLKPYYLLRNPRAASLRPAERHQFLSTWVVTNIKYTYHKLGKRNTWFFLFTWLEN